MTSGISNIIHFQGFYFEENLNKHGMKTFKTLYMVNYTTYSAAIEFDISKFLCT